MLRVRNELHWLNAINVNILFVLLYNKQSFLSHNTFKTSRPAEGPSFQRKSFKVETLSVIITVERRLSELIGTSDSSDNRT